MTNSLTSFARKERLAKLGHVSRLALLARSIFIEEIEPTMHEKYIAMFV